MRSLVSDAVLAVFIAAGIGCAAGSGSGFGGPDMYRETLGQASPHDFSRHTRRILERYHYQIERVDSTASLQVFRTRWRNRYPFDDELVFGAVDARTRLIIQARSRGGAGAGGASDLRVVNFTAENQVLIGDTNVWRHDILTDLFRDYVKEISGALKTEFRGMRVY